MGKPIIMGRKTFESIGRALPGRQNIVLTRQSDASFPGCEVAHSIDEALAIAQGDEVMVIGGADIYAKFLPLAQQLYMTLVHASLIGRCGVSQLGIRKNGRRLLQRRHAADGQHAYPYTFL